jgi:hypothetical protein
MKFHVLIGETLRPRMPFALDRSGVKRQPLWQYKVPLSCNMGH